MMLLGMSLMAADVTFSGQSQFEWLQDFGPEYNFNADAELVATAVFDEMNTAVIDIQYDQNLAPLVLLELDRAYFTTALGKFMGTEEMGVDVTVTWGFNEYDDPSYGQITEWENTDVWEAKFLQWGMGIDVGIMDVVNIEFATDPDPAGSDQMMFGAYGGMNPVWVSLYYDRNGQRKLNDGIIGAAVKVGAIDIMPGMFALTAAVNGYYAMSEDIEASDDSLLTTKIEFGAAIATDIMDMLYLDVGMRGEDDSPFKLVDLAVGGNYMDTVGADIGVGMVLDEDAAPNTFDVADLSVWVMVGEDPSEGGAKFRLGYLYRDKDNPTTHRNGLKAPADGQYNPATSESGVVYLSGTLDF
jgi:hypothetical protein